MRAATPTDTDGAAPDLLSALPPELSAMVADLLTVGDALAVARTRRDVPAVAAEALRTAGVLRRMTAARPWGADAAALVGRVGADALCRAWGIEGAWSHARLLRHLEQRLDRPPAGQVPFGVATCDVPDAVTLVIGPSHPANWTLLRAVVAMLRATTGQGPVMVTAAGRCAIRTSFPVDSNGNGSGDGDGDEVGCRDARARLIFVHLKDDASVGLFVAARVQRDHLPRSGNRGVVVSTTVCTDGCLHIAVDVARVVAMDRACAPSCPECVCERMRPPATGEERLALRAQFDSLAVREWLVVDMWLRRWQRWLPPEAPAAESPPSK